MRQEFQKLDAYLIKIVQTNKWSTCMLYMSLVCFWCVVCILLPRLLLLHFVDSTAAAGITSAPSARVITAL